jgi:hypothetical protein
LSVFAGSGKALILAARERAEIQQLLDDEK